ncbi:MAG: Uma2 family endonuclease [Gemmataceae bacterium]|nr:Uma2 family endonuclease [Gemmataceae bacterium]
MTPVPTAAPATPTPPPMTAEEFVRRHGDESGVELVKGRVVRLPMPGFEHGEVCGNAYALIREFVKAHGLGRVVCNDTFVRVGTDPATYRGADVCFVSYTKLPKEQAPPKGPLEVPPELVVEVRSPTDRPGDVQIKVGEYLNAGVTVVVVLDPNIEAAAVYRQTEDFPQRFSNGDELTLPDVLPGFAVPVRKFFE